MKTADCDFVTAAQLRSTLVDPGDVRGDVAFQNDINGLLAQLEERALPFETMAGLSFPRPYLLPQLKVISGGRRPRSSSSLLSSPSPSPDRLRALPAPMPLRRG